MCASRDQAKPDIGFVRLCETLIAWSAIRVTLCRLTVTAIVSGFNYAVHIKRGAREAEASRKLECLNEWVAEDLFVVME